MGDSLTHGLSSGAVFRTDLSYPALLARELDYPSRVSVGFLSGSAATAEEGLLFTVSGTDAHAWPEVYFEGYGWFPFEPTPFGNPGDNE